MEKTFSHNICQSSVYSGAKIFPNVYFVTAIDFTIEIFLPDEIKLF